MRKMILGDVPALDYASTEAINTLATNVTFSGSQYKTIMLTSCTPNEGKSYVSFNLVRALANMGYTALLLDADLRKSIFMSTYDVSITGPSTGLTHYLAGRCAVNGILYQTNITNVYAIPAGKDVVNSLPLITSPMFFDLMAEMKQNFDFIIIDAPPVGMVIDAAMIASACDATLFVVGNEQVTKRELASAVQQIEKSGCTLLGVVLNRVHMKTHKSRKYYYKSYYTKYGYVSGEYGPDAEGKARRQSLGKRKGPETGTSTLAGSLPPVKETVPPGPKA